MESNNQTKWKNITKQNQAQGYKEQRCDCQRKGGLGVVVNKMGDPLTGEWIKKIWHKI